MLSSQESTQVSSTWESSQKLGGRFKNLSSWGGGDCLALQKWKLRHRG